jgi:hypothetical protein
LCTRLESIATKQGTRSRPASLRPRHLPRRRHRTHGRKACRRRADRGRRSWFRFHFTVHLDGVGDGGPKENTHAARRASIPCLRGFFDRVFLRAALFGSQSTGKPFNVGIQAEESVLCRGLESRLTSSASLRASNVACVLLTRVVRMMRGPRTLPPTDSRRAENRGNRLKSSRRALTSSSGWCQRAQVVSHHVPRAQRCRLLEGRPVEQENVTKESQATRKILTRSSLLASRCASKGSIGRFSALGTYLLCPQPTVNAAHATT